MKSIFAYAAALVCVSGAAAGSAPEAPAGERRAEIINLVRQDCGSCHGLTMKGGLGPPLVPAVIAERDAEQMAFVILNGRPGTPMPPWRDFLKTGEAEWIVEQLRKGLPK